LSPRWLSKASMYQALLCSKMMLMFIWLADWSETCAHVFYCRWRICQRGQQSLTMHIKYTQMWEIRWWQLR
jgi:hypothetical protein